MSQVIAITGKIGSGKNFVMEQMLVPYLHQRGYRVSVLAFADFLKVKCCVEQNISYDRVFTTKDAESRTLLQTCGEQIRELNPFTLIQALDCYIQLTFQRGCDIVLISDVRYKNEFDWLQEKYNARIVRVVAPTRTYDKVLQEAAGNIPKFHEIMNHTSETQLDSCDIATIENDYECNCNIQTLLHKLDMQV